MLDGSSLEDGSSEAIVVADLSVISSSAFLVPLMSCHLSQSIVE
jgi:hypothetical protein